MPLQNEIRDFIKDPNFIMRIQLGLVPGYRVIDAKGERETIQTTATGEDLWRGNELAVAPTSHLLIPSPADAGEQMSFKSESAEDAPGGDGAGSITIEYIDANGAEQTETKDLNGTTLVNTTATDIRFINDMYVATLGTGNLTGVSAGHIFIHKTGTVGLVYSMIAAGGNMSLVPHRMVPADKTLLLQHWTASEKSATKRCTVRLRADCNHTSPPIRQAGVHLFKATAMLDGTSITEPIAHTIPALSVVKASAWASSVNAEAAVHWWGVLVDD